MSFRDFVKENRKYMALGLSQRQMNLPVSNAMGYIISLMPTEGARTSALRWMMSDGLVEASEGRDKMLKVVQQKMSQSGPRLGHQQANIDPLAGLVGMKKEATGVDYKSIPETGDELTAADLFSPQGRQNHGLDGDWIDQMYADQYEPKKMTILLSGKWHDVNLDEMRNLIKSKGLPEFRYGGKKGYLQFIEKGEWRPEHERSSYGDPRQQHGPDLRNAKVDYANGEPVVRFQGGARGFSSNKYKDTIADMRDKFNNTYKKIQNNQISPNYSPEETKALQSLAGDINQIKKSVDANRQGGRSIGAHRAIQTPGNRGAKTLKNVGGKFSDGWQVRPENIETVKKIIQAGVQGEFSASTDVAFKQPEIMGSVRVEGNKTYFTLNPEQQQRLLEKIMAGADQGFFDVKGRWTQIIGPEAGYYNANTPWKISVVVNNGIKALDIEDDLSHVSYGLQGIEPEDYISKIDVKFVPFNMENMAEFEESGYKFKKTANRTPEDMADLPTRTQLWGSLELGADRYRVVRAPESEKMFIELPINKKLRSAPKGGDGLVMHSGGPVSAGDPDLGELDIQPAHSQKEAKRLMSQLLMGKLGEPQGSYSSELDLPSIKHGVQMGKSWAGKNVPTAVIQEIDPAEMLNWGYEALWSFTGHHAFQFGRTSDQEIANTVKSYGGDAELEKEQNPQWNVAYNMGGKTLSTVVPAESKEAAVAAAQQQLGPDVKIMRAKQLQGKGIKSIMHRRGITDPADQEKGLADIQTIIKGLHQGMSPQKLGMSDDLVDSFGENAFEARKRHIGAFVRNKISNHYRERVRSGEKTGQGLEGDDGRGVGYEDQGSQVRGDGGYDSGNVERLKHPDVAARLGVSYEPDQKSVTAISQTMPKQAAPKQAAPKQAAPKQVSPTPPVQAGVSAMMKPRTPNPAAAAAGSTSPLAQMMKKRRQQMSTEQHHFRNYKKWKETAGTSAVYDGTKPKDGDGFNWWGTAGHPLGVSIKGDADKSKEDPKGEEKKNGKQRKRK